MIQKSIGTRKFYEHCNNLFDYLVCVRDNVEYESGYIYYIYYNYN